ncbi:Ser/Thr protein kinase RdoA involved in Cpx stress response, MazF antagonist [Filimonas lacunae]|uniref:Ser/Thr protein kinase RdoA involved in Cpx stress response, MazF antagonist n=1 Tax=Filimonas lacunae TaxID=477680 RepID=A0A173MFU9_9BACT|nr:phosphotransferase [Filimonas lacunae]BAV06473.1 homoserine kinase [Filimonas lacunae]SIT27089.1 Ser/Thr protein kinase RdoA involved in Cpx stress response, MazF antagonist [Filimonas lacunae]
MSSTFPATYSTLSTEALAAFIAQQYSISGAQCEFITRGVGDTYLIKAGDQRFILRVCRHTHRTAAQVTEEIALLLDLHKAGVPVSYPIPDIHNNYQQSLPAMEGERQAVLFSYAPGNVVRVLSPAQLQTLGAQIARFHKAAARMVYGNSRWTFNTSTTLFNPLQKLQPRFADNPEDYRWLTQAATQIADLLDKTDTSGFATGYCHFDFLPKNFHFEGDAVTFFDFDFMGYGWQVNDLMSYWQHLQLDVYAGRMKQEDADNMFSQLVAAYREHNSVSEAELALIPYLSLGFWLFYMGFHTTHDQFYTFLQPTTLKIYTGFLRNLASKHWSLIQL